VHSTTGEITVILSERSIIEGIELKVPNVYPYEKGELRMIPVNSIC
jgi:hypothetical protein